MIVCIYKGFFVCFLIYMSISCIREKHNTGKPEHAVSGGKPAVTWPVATHTAHGRAACRETGHRPASLAPPKQGKGMEMAPQHPTASKEKRTPVCAEELSPRASHETRKLILHSFSARICKKSVLRGAACVTCRSTREETECLLSSQVGRALGWTVAISHY